VPLREHSEENSAGGILRVECACAVWALQSGFFLALASVGGSLWDRSGRLHSSDSGLDTSSSGPREIAEIDALMRNRASVVP